MNRPTLLLTLIWLSSLLGLPADAAQAPVCKAPTLTANIDWPPSSYEEPSGKLAGASIEIVEQVMQDLGLCPKIVNAGPWKRAQSAVASGEVDFIMGAYRTPEREVWAEYADAPLHLDRVVVFVRKDDDLNIENLGDLIPHRGSITLGTSLGAKFDRFRDKLDIHWVREHEVALRLLSKGRIRYVAIGEATGTFAALRAGLQDEFKILDYTVAAPVLHLLVSKKSPCRRLIAQIDRQLRDYYLKGTSDIIFRRHFDVVLRRIKNETN